MLMLLSFGLSVNGQIFACKDYWNLRMDSTYLHKMSYPYIKVKRAFNSSQNPFIIAYYQGFNEALLYDVDTLNFELINIKDKTSSVIRVIVDSSFGVHREEPRYMLNDFCYFEDVLYLLVFNTLYSFEVRNNSAILANVWHLDRGYNWFSIVEKEKGIFIDYSYKDGKSTEILFQKLIFPKGSDSCNQLISLPLSFEGRPFLQAESSFISESMNKIFLGDGTSSKISVVSKHDLKLEEEFHHSKFKASLIFDSIEINNKMQLLKAINNDSSNLYHYQTCYASDSVILRSRTRVAYKTEHYLDIFRKKNIEWDSIGTLLEGAYNIKRFKDTTTAVSIFNFDPFSATKGNILIDDKFYTIDFQYELVRKRSIQEGKEFYVFPVKDLNEIPKALFGTKNFRFSIYQYQVF